MSEHSPDDPELEGLPEHPKGTLAIVLIYAGLFALGWFAFYIFLFLGRGAPTH